MTDAKPAAVAHCDGQIEWVVLATGGRPDALKQATRSLPDSAATVVLNAEDPCGERLVDETLLAASRLVLPGESLGVPGGRAIGLAATSSPVVGFLDDDAEPTCTSATKKWNSLGAWSIPGGRSAISLTFECFTREPLSIGTPMGDISQGETA